MLRTCISCINELGTKIDPASAPAPDPPRSAVTRSRRREQVPGAAAAVEHGTGAEYIGNSSFRPTGSACHRRNAGTAPVVQESLAANTLQAHQPVECAAEGEPKFPHAEACAAGDLRYLLAHQATTGVPYGWGLHSAATGPE